MCSLKHYKHIVHLETSGHLALDLINSVSMKTKLLQKDYNLLEFSVTVISYQENVLRVH
jgi:hypothetical protein